MEALHREQLLEEFFSRTSRICRRLPFPSIAIYVADRFNFFTNAYTPISQPDEVPNTYEDLVPPAFRGPRRDRSRRRRLVRAPWSSAMGEEKGPAFFRKLSAAKPEIRSGHTLMAELVASGEIPSPPPSTTITPSRRL